MENNGFKAVGTHDILKPAEVPEQTLRQVLGLIYSLGIARRVFKKKKKRQQQ